MCLFGIWLCFVSSSFCGLVIYTFADIVTDSHVYQIFCLVKDKIIVITFSFTMKHSLDSQEKTYSLQNMVTHALHWQNSTLMLALISF